MKKAVISVTAFLFEKEWIIYEALYYLRFFVTDALKSLCIGFGKCEPLTYKVSSKYIILPYSGYYQRGTSTLLTTGTRGIYIASNSFSYNEVVPYVLEFVKYSMWNNGCNSGYSDRITPIRPVTQ